MEEQLINFETAKLAKEKGFKGVFSNKSYSPDGKKGDWVHDYDFNARPSVGAYKNQITVCTQTILQKWLRDEYNILVFPYLNIQEKDYFYCSIFVKNSDRLQTGDFDTYEEALENGLLEALKLIK